MDHIQYAKNVLDEGTLNNLQQFCLQHYEEIPIYNFARKTEKPKNYFNIRSNFSQQYGHCIK